MTTPTEQSRTGRVRVPHLDLTALEDQQAALVTAALEDAPTDAVDRLKFIADMEHAAHTVVTANEELMYKLALSLALHEGARSVNRSIGVSREWFSRRTAAALGNWAERPNQWDETVPERARAQGVRFYRGAVKELPPIAEKVAGAKIRLELLRPHRDKAILAATEAGLTRAEVGAIIGRNASRVSHITTGRG